MTTRMGVSLTAAIAFHIALLILLELFVNVTEPFVPDYFGPIIVELEPLGSLEPPVVEPPTETLSDSSPAPSAPLPVTPPSEPTAVAPGVETPEGATPAADSSVRRTTAEQLREALGRLGPDTPDEPREISTTAQAEHAPRIVREHTPSEAPPPPFIPNENAGQMSTPSGTGAGDASSEGQSDDGPSLSYGELDQALEGRETGSATTQTGSTGGSAATPSRDATFDIRWEDPAVGREPVSTPEPVLPDWVSRQGARLRLVVRFDLTSAGLLTDVTIEESSGYSDVDAAVLKALRWWRFAPVTSGGVVRGRVPYVILPR